MNSSPASLQKPQLQQTKSNNNALTGFHTNQDNRKVQEMEAYSNNKNKKNNDNEKDDKDKKDDNKDDDKDDDKDNSKNKQEIDDNVDIVLDDDTSTPAPTMAVTEKKNNQNNNSNNKNSNNQNGNDNNAQTTNTAPSPTSSPTILQSSQPSIAPTSTNTTANSTANTSPTHANNIIVFLSVLPNNNNQPITNNQTISNEILSFTTKSLCYQLNNNVIITTDDTLYSSVTNICNQNKYRRTRERTNQRNLFEEYSNNIITPNENTTILQIANTSMTESFMYVIQKAIIEHNLNYYEVGIKYNILKIGNDINRNILQEEAQAAIIRSIIEYNNNTNYYLNNDIIQDISIVGDELTSFALISMSTSSSSSQGFFTTIRLFGISCFCMTMLSFSIFCYIANHKNKEVDNDKKNYVIVINSQQGVDSMLEIGSIDKDNESITSVNTINKSDDILSSKGSSDDGEKLSDKPTTLA